MIRKYRLTELFYSVPDPRAGAVIVINELEKMLKLCLFSNIHRNYFDEGVSFLSLDGPQCRSMELEFLTEMPSENKNNLFMDIYIETTNMIYSMYGKEINDYGCSFSFSKEMRNGDDIVIIDLISNETLQEEDSIVFVEELLSSDYFYRLYRFMHMTPDDDSNVMDIFES